MVRHDDQEHPHVHVTVRAVGRDGRRLARGKEQLQVWREDFAASCAPEASRRKRPRGAPVSVHVRGGLVRAAGVGEVAIGPVG